MTNGGETRPIVLVADDDQAVADLYSTWLSQEYTVVTAYSGEEALELMDQDVDVALLDRRMPDVHGDLVLTIFRDLGFNCPVAMVTAIVPDFDVLELGFDAYLQKKVDRDCLLEAVEELIGWDSVEDLQRELSTKRLQRNILKQEKTELELQNSEEFCRVVREIDRIEAHIDGRQHAVSHSPSPSRS